MPLSRERSSLGLEGAHGEVSLGEVSFPCRVARYDGARRLSKINYQEKDRGAKEGDEAGEARCTACLRACMAAGVHGATYIQETPRTRRRRRGRDRREEEEARRRRRHDAEEAATTLVRARLERGGNGGRHGPITKKQLTATHSRCTKDGKVEEHPLEPVRPLGASGRAPSCARARARGQVKPEGELS